MPVPSSDTAAGRSGRSLMEHADLESVDYLPLRDLIAGFEPTKNVSQYLLEDAMPVLSPALQAHMAEIVRQCGLSTQSRISSGDLLKKYPGMTAQSAFAINLYSMDARRIADVPRNVNFFVEYCNLLRLRDSRINEQLRGYSYFLFKGLSLLPDWQGIALRGIDREGVDKFNVKDVYAQGKLIHWTALSSTTVSFETACSQFSDAGGVVFEIHVKTGKDIRDFSVFGDAEGEILLLPNFKCVVTSGVKLKHGVEVIELVERMDEVFVF